MQLKKVSIKNFRSIQTIDIILQESVNVLVGPNGSGKTNILKAINGCLSKSIIDHSCIYKNDYWFGTKEPIDIDVVMFHKEKQFKINFLWARGQNNYANPHDIQSLIGYYHYFPCDRFIRSANLNLDNRRNDIRNRFRNDLLENENLYGNIVDMKFSSPERLDTLSREIHKVYPNLEELSVKIDNKNYQHGELLAKVNGYLFPLDSLSSGLQQLIAFISVIHFSKNSLILIDEPELHMNPGMVISLSQLIRESSKKNKNQFIIATHSSALISTPHFNVIPIVYRKINGSFSTCQSEIIAEGFASASFLKR